MPVSLKIAPNRLLFTMLRVRDLEQSVGFYRDLLGMTELGRETYPDAKFTAVFMGYGVCRKYTLAHIADPDGYRIELLEN